MTNLDKVLFPPGGCEHPVTKRDLVRYAAQVAPDPRPPYLTRRALNMHRVPKWCSVPKASGTRNCPDHAPEWLPSLGQSRAPIAARTRTYLVVDEPGGAGRGRPTSAPLEWHAWTSRSG